MIYFVIFAYLFVLALLYDVLGYRKHYNWHFVVSLIILILVSGFRYRLGADTATYMGYYDRYCHDIFHLSRKDFSDYVYNYEPLWVILNSFCKTITGSFYLVQLSVSTIHILTWGYFIKKVCPSICFIMLVFFFLFEWLHMDFVLMREAVAIAFFLLSILAINNKQFFRAILFTIIAMLFHRFSIMVFILLFLYYSLLSKYRYLGILSVMLFIGIGLVKQNWIYDVLGGLVGVDSVYAEKMVAYGDSGQFGIAHWSWKGEFILYASVVFYLISIYWIKDRYDKYSLLNHKIFESAIIVGCIILSIKTSFPIAYRFYDYIQTFTSLLCTIVLMQLKDYNILLKYKLLIFIIYMFFPIRHFYSSYIKSEWGGNPNVKRFLEFYPYHSILDPQKDTNREMGIMNYKRFK